VIILLPMYEILALFSTEAILDTLWVMHKIRPDCHLGNAELTQSQSASSRLIFLLPLMAPGDPCQLPLYK
jgi:hypothetical protein